MKSSAVGIVSIVFLAGCVGIASSGLSGNATLVLTPRIHDGSFNTQTLIHKYVQADIDHVNLYLKVGAATKSTKVVPIANIANSIVFSNLRENTTYTVLAEAISTSSAKISDDASSSMTITVGYNDAPTVGVIPVGLINSTFNGTGTNSIAVTNGSYFYAASESIATQ